MFDPERDEDPGAGRYYLRLLAVVVISAIGCVALWPSVSGFSAGPDHQTGCLAIADGWKAEKSAPSADSVPGFAPLTEAERADPAALARWRAQFQAWQARPEVQQAMAYQEWRNGAGACVHESRHRLILSGIGLALLVAACTGVALVLRTRKDPAPKRRVDPDLVNA